MSVERSMSRSTDSSMHCWTNERSKETRCFLFTGDSVSFVYAGQTATAAQAFCPPLPVTARVHCAAEINPPDFVIRRALLYIPYTKWCYCRISTPPHSTTAKPFLSKGSSCCGSISTAFSSGTYAMKTRHSLSGVGVIVSFAEFV